jgi:transcriptional regulator with XRE-family HTH domain
MDSGFGARLRLQRERQGVSLGTIAANTKIKITLLEGLERDDISQWPSGIFRRSYVRTYAQAIGLEPDAVVRDFLDQYPDPVEEASPVEAMARAEGVTGRRPPTRLTYLINSAISALPTRRGASSSSGTVSPAPPAAGMDEVAPLPAPLSVPATAPLRAEAEYEPAREGSHAQGVEDHESIELPTLSGGAAGVQGTLADFADWDTVEMAAVPIMHSPAAAPDAESDAPEWTDPLLRPDLAEAADASWASLGRATQALEAPVPLDPDVEGLADLCTRLGRAQHAEDVLTILRDATAMTRAIGLILWTWDPHGRTLRPALNHGYPAELLAQVRGVSPDSDNAIASAFRSSEVRLVDGTDTSTGAVAVPLLAPFGCVGVLAAEFRDGTERRATVRAALSVLAAQLSMLIEPVSTLRAATA